MSSDPLQNQILVSFNAQRMEQQQRYLEAGRQHKAAATDLLITSWKQHFAAYARVVGPGDAWEAAQLFRRQAEDAEAELSLRGFDVPYGDEDMKPHLTLLQKKATEAVHTASPDELAEGNASIMADMSRLLGTSDRKN